MGNLQLAVSCFCQNKARDVGNGLLALKKGSISFCSCKGIKGCRIFLWAEHIQTLKPALSKLESLTVQQYMELKIGLSGQQYCTPGAIAAVKGIMWGIFLGTHTGTISKFARENALRARLM